MKLSPFRLSALIACILVVGTPEVSAQGRPSGLHAEGMAPGPLKHPTRTTGLPWPGHHQVQHIGLQPSGRSSLGPIHRIGMGQGALSQVPDASWAFAPLQQNHIAGDRTDPWLRRLAVVQGSYYLATGLWPILSMRTFERVTGPKTDDWLVKTVGALIAVAGGTLLVSGLGDGPSDDLQLMAAGSAGALAVVDVTYVARGRISRIYLLDAVAEIALLSGWLLL